MGAYALFHLNKGSAAGTQILDTKLWEEMHAVPFGGHYGLGITRTRAKFGEKVINWFTHNGGGFGFGSIFSFYPEANVAWVALFNNSEAPYNEFGDSLSHNIISRLYGERNAMLPAKNQSSVDVPEAVLENYVGNYIGRGDVSVDFKFNDGAFGMQNGSIFKKMTFSTPVDSVIAGPHGEAHTLRFDSAQRGETARVEWPDGPSDLDYNDGPHDIAGPNKKEWGKYLGDYQLMRWGKRSKKATVHIKNGYLYIDSQRLIVEIESGLFFAANGEALDFRGKLPTFGNIPLEQISAGHGNK
jgi:hypothetical protein